jgi:hypothetical protein
VTLTGLLGLVNSYVYEGIFFTGTQILNVRGMYGDFFECTFDVTQIENTTTFRKITFRDCTVTVTDEITSADATFRVFGGTWNMNGGSSEYICSAAFGADAQFIFDGVDFSGGTWNGNMFRLAEGQPATSMMAVRHCKFPSGFMASLVSKNAFNAIGHPPFQFLVIEHCSDGTITTAELDHQFYVDKFGHIETVIDEVRTGGAEYDGVGHSWKITSSADDDPKERWITFECPELVTFVTGGSEITATIFIATASTTLQDDDIFAEFSGPNTGSPAEPFPDRFSSRTAVDGTPANLTTDGDSTWTGTDTGSGTLQKIVRTYTPGINGLLRVKIFVAKPSQVLYIAPRIEIT